MESSRSSGAWTDARFTARRSSVLVAAVPRTSASSPQSRSKKAAVVMPGPGRSVSDGTVLGRQAAPETIIRTLFQQKRMIIGDDLAEDEIGFLEEPAGHPGGDRIGPDTGAVEEHLCPGLMIVVRHH